MSSAGFVCAIGRGVDDMSSEGVSGLTTSVDSSKEGRDGCSCGAEVSKGFGGRSWKGEGTE